MTTIYLIRHGEVENPEQIWYGRLPGYGLSKRGKKEITQTAHYLADKKIAHLYTSPLQRAQESMEIIKEKLKMPEIFTSEDLLEVKSVFQGKPISVVTPMRFDWFFTRERGKTDDKMEGVRDRMHNFLRTMHTKHPHETVAALSHGDPLMIIKAHINGLPMSLDSIREGHYLSHGEVLKVDIDDDKATIESVFIPK